MKPENELRLARIASNDVRNGGARALTLAKRILSLHRSSDADEIVNRVYTHPTGRASYDCRECGQPYLSGAEASECCNEN